MNIYFKNEDEINTFFDQKKKKTLKIVNNNNPSLKKEKY